MFVIALLALAEATKVERIVLATGIDVVGKQIVMSNQVAFVGMIPEVADILDQFAIVINQGVVDRNNAILTVAGSWIVLQPLKPVRVDALDLPGCFSQPPIERGLVWWGSELSRDTAHCLVLRYQQPGQVFGEVAA
jgi:hypothetical protein